MDPFTPSTPPRASDPGGAGLYLHVPFCSAVCPYCDFAVLTGGREKRARFVEALIAEMRLWRGLEWTFDTIYFGGGTPTALQPEQLGRIIDEARECFDLAADTHITMEANPEDVQASLVSAWQDLSVDMVSLGVQSFQSDELTFLGRRHDPEQARASVRALSGQFATVSLDLMFGLPHQTLEAWRASLAEAAELQPDHISCYQLTIHEGTTFGRWRDSGRLQELEDDFQADYYMATHEALEANGLVAYEVSNFSRSRAQRSPHNQKYWYHVPYLGLGPSAHSFDGSSRWWNHRALVPYQESIESNSRPLSGREELSPRDLALEALMLRLRTADGLSLPRFAERYGGDLSASGNKETLRHWVRDGFAELADDHFRLTRKGLAIVDAVVRSLDVSSVTATGPDRPGSHSPE